MAEVIDRVLERPQTETQTPADPKLATVAVVGLGYVGLPVAVAFGKQRRTIGYDLSKKRIENLRHHVDATGEVSTADLLASRHLKVTASPGDLAQADFIIVALNQIAPDLPFLCAMARRNRIPLLVANRIGFRRVYPGVPEFSALTMS